MNTASHKEDSMTEIAYHTIDIEARGAGNIFVTKVYRGGELVDVDIDTGEPTYEGGRHVATLYRRSYGEACKAGIDYSFICAPRSA